VYKEVENCRLLIVGDGPLRAELEQEARECGVDGFVHFAGAQSEPERFFSEMDVFALTSRSEGMPLVVLEAWAAGVPVVASAVGGLPELIRDGETGMLFPPGDAATLARTLAKLLQEPTLRTRLAEQAWTEVRERFDVRRTAEAYQLCYNEMLPSPAQAQVCGF
jgi:glycosyltransferase involved in cell wall biosynthesis